MVLNKRVRYKNFDQDKEREFKQPIFSLSWVYDDC